MFVKIRNLVLADIPVIEHMLSRIKEFHRDDQLLALELIQVAITQPNQKDYEFLVAVDENDLAIGYACYGPTPLTDRTYDLYWIAVGPDDMGKGIGTQLIQAMEQSLTERKARLIVIETTSDPIYEQTRKFYRKNGYRLAETIKDFFRDGEDRITYIKRLSP